MATSSSSSATRLLGLLIGRVEVNSSSSPSRRAGPLFVAQRCPQESSSSSSAAKRLAALVGWRSGKPVFAVGECRLVNGRPPTDKYFFAQLVGARSGKPVFAIQCCAGSSSSVSSASPSSSSGVLSSSSSASASPSSSSSGSLSSSLSSESSSSPSSSSSSSRGSPSSSSGPSFSTYCVDGITQLEQTTPGVNSWNKPLSACGQLDGPGVGGNGPGHWRYIDACECALCIWETDDWDGVGCRVFTRTQSDPDHPELGLPTHTICSGPCVGSSSSGCPSISGWQGGGWYCVMVSGSCTPLELVDANRCDTSIVICSGVYASEAAANAVCGPVTTYCVDGTDELAQTSPTLWTGTSANSLQNLGGGNWQYINAIVCADCVWTASGWDGTGCKVFTRVSGEFGPDTYTICAGPC